MNNLKHIKLFEAFKSGILSGTLKYINSESKEEFLDNVKRICNIYDFPPSELSDDFFEYLPFKQALRFGETKGETYLIKFWFSSDGELSEITGTGDKNKIYEKGKKLSRSEVRELETGTKILVNFDYQHNNILSTIFKYDGEIYFIQNKMIGSIPENNDWKKYGEYSWSLTADEEYYEVVYLDSPETNYKINISDSIEISSELTDLTDSNFAIILNLENIKKYDYNKVSKKREIRSKEKIGALALKSDEEIKELNIEKYIDSIVKKLNIDDKDINDVKDVKSMISKVLGQNSTIDNLSEMYFSYKVIGDIADTFVNIFKYKYDWFMLNSRDKNYYINQVKRIIESKIRDNLQNSIKILKNLNKLKLEIESISEDNENKIKYKELFDNIIESKRMLNDKIKSVEIESIGDLYVLEEKLKGLSNISRRVDIEKYFFRRLYEENRWNMLSNIDDIDELLKSMKIVKNYIKNF